MTPVDPRSVPDPIAPPPVELTPAEELIEATHTNKVALSSGSAELRRSTIAYYFVEMYGCPSEDSWPLVVTDLINRLRMPVGSRDAVYSIFKDVVHCRLDKTKFSSKVKGGRGRKLLIQKGSVDEKLILVALEQSLSVTEATAIVNLARSAQGLPTVSWSAVENFTLKSESVQKRSRRISAHWSPRGKV